MKRPRQAALRGPLTLAVLYAVPLVLWASLRRSPPVRRAVHDAHEHRGALRLRRHLGVRGQPRPRRAASAGRGVVRRPRPDVPRAPGQRAARVPAAALPHSLHAGEPGDALADDSARPAPSRCGLDRLRRGARVRCDDRLDPPDVVRASRARGLHLRPAVVRVHLPGRVLPRLHDTRREVAVGRAELGDGGGRHGRRHRVRLSLGVREPPRPPASVPRRCGEPARRLRHGGRDGAALEPARLHPGAVRVRELSLARDEGAAPALPALDGAPGLLVPVPARSGTSSTRSPSRRRRGSGG